MKKMILVTDTFPFGVGESTFIQPELKWLVQEFEVSIVSCGSSMEKTSGTPADVGVYRCPKNQGSWFWGCIKAVFDPMFYREIPGCFKHSKNALLAILQCIDYYGESESFAQQFKGVIGAEGVPDIIYCYWHRPALLGVLRSKKLFPDTKIIARAHGYDLYAERYATGYIPYKTQEDEVLDAVFLACKAGLEYYKEHYSVSQPPKYDLGYLGVDNSRTAPWEPCDTLRLFSCSGMLPVKRLHLIIDALSQIKDIKIKWTHAGGGKLEEGLRKMAADKLGKSSNVEYEMLGNIHNEELREHLATVPYDFFITTSESEGGVPVSIVEACSFGLPIIATNVGGIPEIVSDDNGILLSANPSVEEIEKVLRKAAAMDPEDCDYMRFASRKKWQERFVAADNAKIFIQKLAKLCEK